MHTVMFSSTHRLHPEHHCLVMDKDFTEASLLKAVADWHLVADSGITVFFESSQKRTNEMANNNKGNEKWENDYESYQWHRCWILYHSIFFPAIGVWKLFIWKYLQLSCRLTSTPSKSKCSLIIKSVKLCPCCFQMLAEKQKSDFLPHVNFIQLFYVNQSLMVVFFNSLSEHDHTFFSSDVVLTLPLHWAATVSHIHTWREGKCHVLRLICPHFPSLFWDLHQQHTRHRHHL